MTRIMRRLSASALLPLAVTASATPAPSTRPESRVRYAVDCEAPTISTVERQYTVRGRLKLLLIWTGRRDVGQAQFIRVDHVDGSRHLELLVGTDPDQAPRRINRWGYIAETSCGGATYVTGVMTESNEQSVEQAEARAGDRRHIPLRAIRSRVSVGESTTELATIQSDRALTYKEVDQVLALIPLVDVPVRTTVPRGAEAGFLAAVTSLIDETLDTLRQPQKPRSRLRRTYVYAGTLYEMQVTGMRTIQAGKRASELESEFEVRNSRTGSTAEFQIAYGAAGATAGAARRIVFRPRWWLELELLLKEPAQ